MAVRGRRAGRARAGGPDRRPGRRRSRPRRRRLGRARRRPSRRSTSRGSGTDKVAVVPVEGTIASADTSVPGTQPPVTPEGLADALDQAAEDPAVAAVVLEVNSPGGGVTASDEMQQSILDFKRVVRQAGRRLHGRHRGLGRLLHLHRRRQDSRQRDHHHRLSGRHLLADQLRRARRRVRRQAGGHQERRVQGHGLALSGTSRPRSARSSSPSSTSPTTSSSR